MIDSPSYSGTRRGRLLHPRAGDNSSDLDSAPLIAASVFLDALNVFLFFLRLFTRNRD
jgi:hypothetical protein